MNCEEHYSDSYNVEVNPEADEEKRATFYETLKAKSEQIRSEFPGFDSLN